MKQKFFFILVVLVLITTPALAGKVNVATADVGAQFGAVIPGKILTSISTLDWTLTIEVEVRKKYDSVLNTDIYTYIYTFTDSGTSPDLGILGLTIDSGWFDNNLNWGTVGSPPDPDYLSNVFFDSNLSFQFASLPVPSGTTTTVYAQSTVAPGDVHFWANAFGSSGGNENTDQGDVSELAASPVTPSTRAFSITEVTPLVIRLLPSASRSKVRRG